MELRNPTEPAAAEPLGLLPLQPVWAFMANSLSII
jgi:hypothetical protein